MSAGSGGVGSGSSVRVSFPPGSGPSSVPSSEAGGLSLSVAERGLTWSMCLRRIRPSVSLTCMSTQSPPQFLEAISVTENSFLCKQFRQHQKTASCEHRDPFVDGLALV